MKKIVMALALTLALSLTVTACASDNKKGETTTGSSSETTAKPAPNVDMAAVEKEIGSKWISDFDPSDTPTEYVRMDVKDYGSMIIRLRGDVAPKTVQNFQDLVAKNFYDNLTFHRVIKGFMIQGGDPKGDGSGSSDHLIKGEFSANGVQNDLKHIKGVISMARAQPMDSASCQFFICNDVAANLNGQYAAFGYVVAGLDTLDLISDVEVKSNGYENSTPAEKIVIEKIRFVKPEAVTSAETTTETTAGTTAETTVETTVETTAKAD